MPEEKNHADEALPETPELRAAFLRARAAARRLAAANQGASARPAKEAAAPATVENEVVAPPEEAERDKPAPTAGQEWVEYFRKKEK